MPRSAETKSRRRALVFRTAAISLLVLAITATIAWRFLRYDDRAYPGSGSRASLETALTRYNLRLPDCALDSVRFGIYGQAMVHKLFVDFSADAGCWQRFLGINQFSNITTYESNGIPFGPPDGERLGWPGAGNGLTYDTIEAELEPHEAGMSQVYVSMSVDKLARPHHVYLSAGHS